MRCHKQRGLGYSTLLLFFMLAASAAIGAIGATVPPQGADDGICKESSMKIDPLLMAAMDENCAGKIPVLIELKDRQKIPFGSMSTKTLTIKSQERVTASLGAIPAESIKQHWIVNVVSAKVPAGAIECLASHPDVEKVWLDRKIAITEPAAISASGADYGDSIVSAPSLWGIGYNGTGVNISILDTGIDDTHPDLDCGGVTLEYDFTDDSTTDDMYGHGTHCAGIAAGERNTTTDVSGVAHGATLFNAKVMNQSGVGYESWVISGIEWSVAQHADVLSMSFGSWQRDGTGGDLLGMAVSNAVASGCVAVVAAGNSGPGEGTIGSPAVAYGAIAVAATDSGDAIASSSSRGPTGDGRVGIDLAAPGVGIKSASASWEGAGSDYTTMGGTSMACPHVAGAAALLLHAYPNLTPAEVEIALMNSADGIGYDTLERGAGRLNVSAAYNALVCGTLVNRSEWFVGNVHQGNHTVTFTVFNHNDSNVTVNITRSSGDAGDWITISDVSLVVPANGNATFDATMNMTGTVPGAYNGGITVGCGSGNITIPVSVNVLQAVGSSVICSIEGTVDEASYGSYSKGDWVYYTLDLQAGIANLNLSLNWTNSGTDLDLYLFDPDGNQTGSSATLAHPEVNSVNDPQSGNWTVAINAWSLATGHETYNLTITTGVITDATPPVVISATASPATIEANGTENTLLNVTATDASSTIANVTVNLTTIGGSQSQAMTNNSGVWQFTTNTTTIGTFSLPVNVTDAAGNSNTSARINLTAEDTTPPVITSATASPSTIEANGTENTLLNVTATDAISTIANVTINLTVIGGLQSQAMTNNSGVWQFTTNTTTIGTFSLPVNVTDAAGNSNTSAGIALVAKDTTPPVITGIRINKTIHSATITWNTSESSDSLIRYGTTSGSEAYTETAHNETDTTDHRIDLSGLRWNTTYYLVVNSTDQARNSNESEEHNFTTPNNATISVDATANESVLIDAMNETDTAINLVTSRNVSGNVTVTVASNASDLNPASNPLDSSYGLGTGEHALGKYIRINVSDGLNTTSNNVTWAEVRVYYTVADLDRDGDGDATEEGVDLDESKLHIYWQNRSDDGCDWIKLTTGLNLSYFDGPVVYNVGVNTTDVSDHGNGYAGYVWANVSGFSIYGLGGSLLPESTDPNGDNDDGNGNGGGGSSSGGGGGGASGEAYANIALSENIEQEIIKNRTVSYEFVKSGNDILFLNLTPVVNYGTVFARIEILRNTSTLIRTAPPGIVYRNVNIWLGPTGFADKVRDITISFVVERSWIDENGIATSTIRLYRYDRASGEWTSLPTSIAGKDDTHVYFTADATDFAGFAITGRNEPTSAPVMPKSASAAVTTAATSDVATAAATSGAESATPKSRSGIPAPGALSVAAITGFAALLLKRRRG